MSLCRSPDILSTSQWLWVACRIETQAYKTGQAARKLWNYILGDSDFPLDML